MSEEREGSPVELDELLLRPGTYFNPQTEVVVIVDDSASIDQEVFDADTYEGVEWVRVSDEVPVDHDSLDTALEAFQARHHAGSHSGLGVTAAHHDDDAYHDAEEDLDLEPDPDPEDE